MRFFSICLLCLVFFGCKESQTSQDTQNAEHIKNTQTSNTIEEQEWLFNTQYVKTIHESSWERLSIQALNDFSDFKLEFSYISTGKPQTCGLYAKGVVANDTSKAKQKKQIKILMRPNLIPDSAIWITYNAGADNANIEQNNRIHVEITDIAGFIQACGDAHQYAMGEYNSVQ